jgi:hypothetical protein
MTDAEAGRRVERWIVVTRSGARLWDGNEWAEYLTREEAEAYLGQCEDEGIDARIAHCVEVTTDSVIASPSPSHAPKGL